MSKDLLKALAALSPILGGVLLLLASPHLERGLSLEALFLLSLLAVRLLTKAK